MMSTATAPPRAPETVLAARAEGLTKVFGEVGAEVRAVDGISLDIHSGQFTAVMGPSGSGKSTLMQCMAGLDRITSGRAWLGGEEITSLSEKRLTRLRREAVGFIFQSYNVVPTLPLRENVLLPLSIAGRRPDPEWFDRVVGALGLTERLAHRPAELSGGQQQRAAAARALIARPAVIFADEPTGALDSRSGDELLGVLREAVDAQGQTVVAVTHDPRAAAVADRVVFLRDGRIAGEIASPSADEVLDRMKSLGGGR